MTAVPEGFCAPGELRSPLTVRQDVAWGELDALGHVNHTVFLRWLENARFAWFDAVGMAALMHQSEGRLGPILARASCEYRAPVTFPDRVWTNIRCAELGRSSMRLISQVWSQARAAVVAEGEVVVVLVDYAGGGSEAVPEPVRAAIRALDGAGLEERGR